MKAIKHLMQYIKPYIWITILAPLLMVIEVFMDLLQPTIMQFIIDEGIAKNDMSIVISYAIIMIVLAIIGLGGGLGCIYFSSKVGVHVATDLRKDLYEVMSYFSTKKRDEVGTGKLITIMTSDVEMIQRALMMLLRIFVRGPLMFIGAVIIVWFTARELFNILLVIVPILMILIITFTIYSGKIFRKVQQSVDRVNEMLSENLAGIRVIKAFHRMKEQMDKFLQINKKLTKLNQNANMVMGFLNPLTMWIVNLGIVAALWIGVIQVEIGAIQIGVILAFVNYLNLIMGGLMMSVMVLMQVARAVPSLDRVYEMFNIEGEERHQKQDLHDIKGDVTFENVSFSYNENGENIVDQLNFHVNAGETVGIIGMTGTGKSTLLKLIPRLYDVSKGKIKIDGKDIQSFTLESLRKQIAFAPQKALLFAGSIASNLKFGSPNAVKEDMHHALDQANAMEFVEKYDDQVEHELSFGAKNLSGGQKQRLAMARAFIKDAKILILDDTTSAVDTISEKIIKNHLINDFKEQTLFIVSSKIATIQHADQIILMDDGRIHGIGTHDELLATNEEYREIYLLQQQSGGVLDAE